MENDDEIRKRLEEQDNEKTINKLFGSSMATDINKQMTIEDARLTKALQNMMGDNTVLSEKIVEQIKDVWAATRENDMLQILLYVYFDNGDKEDFYCNTNIEDFQIFNEIIDMTDTEKRVENVEKMEKKMYLLKTYPILFKNVMAAKTRTLRVRRQLAHILLRGRLMNDNEHFLIQHILYHLDNISVAKLFGHTESELSFLEKGKTHKQYNLTNIIDSLNRPNLVNSKPIESDRISLDIAKALSKIGLNIKNLIFKNVFNRKGFEFKEFK